MNPFGLPERAPSGQMAPEAWHVVGDPGEPTFENGWTAIVPLWFRSVAGELRIVGIVSGGTPGSTIFTLDAGHTPTLSNTFALGAGQSGTDPLEVIAIQVDTDEVKELPGLGTPHDLVAIGFDFSVPLD